MADEIDIDNILEDDMLNALEELNVNTSDNSNESEIINKPLSSNISEKVSNKTINETQTLNIDSSNINDIVSILKELLNNKSLEITIRLKDN